MKTLGYYNGRIDELDRISVPMLDRACYFGDGVYDVTFSRNYNIYMLQEHVERIFQSAALLKIFPGISPHELCELLCHLTSEIGDKPIFRRIGERHLITVTDGRLRLLTAEGDCLYTCPAAMLTDSPAETLRRVAGALGV